MMLLLALAAGSSFVSKVIVGVFVAVVLAVIVLCLDDRGPGDDFDKTSW